MRRLGLLLLLGALGAAVRPAGAAPVSSDLGGVFDDIGEGARPLGMGDAFVAVADDANAADENPAGMAFFDPNDRYATFTHSALFDLGFINRDYVSYAQGDQGYGALAVSWNQLSVDLEPGTWDEDAFSYSGAKQVYGFNADDWFKASVGWELQYLRVATNLGDDSQVSGVDNNAITQDNLSTSVSGGNANGGALGLGAMLKFGPQFNVGLLARNLYSQVTWGTGTEEVEPMELRLGGAYRLDDDTLFAAEVRGQQLSSGFGASTYNFGAERKLLDGKELRWGIVRNIALRAGYYQVVYNGDGGVLTGGATLESDMWSVDYTYEYDASGGLGDTQRFGLDLKF